MTLQVYTKRGERRSLKYVCAEKFRIEKHNLVFYEGEDRVAAFCDWESVILVKPKKQESQ